MEATTIAFNTKTGDWSTRYSFLSNCYGFLNKLFFSNFETESAFVPWLHNSDKASRTQYYSKTYGSGISVTFNDNVSTNKIYKSFSLEGTSNITGENYFVVNTDNSPDKRYSLGKLKDKGGILYGHIGQAQNMMAGGNLELVGVIDSMPFVNNGLMGLAITTTENDLLPSSADSLYILGEPQDDGGIVFTSLYGPLTGQSTINSEFIEFPPTDLASVGSNQEDLEYAVSIINGQVIKTIAFNSALGNPQDPSGKLLFEVNPSNIFGDEPRGQYAEAIISLGSLPYELYSLNVDYEPTNLDHSGQ